MTEAMIIDDIACRIYTYMPKIQKQIRMQNKMRAFRTCCTA
jgi:hypothetical protein